ncbi:MAG: hypothetical protein DCF15_16570 [Phormidesmis priestleyi]|uniref:Low-complexity tail membrane protein n=1 Tax=Phormidesmis priestleyi TaxID=268141 RepID=A0A2W4X600_9CYAN|nr:MAG: hypothetical protein DCF15_16570 [Phormidesmis priestleyi]
MIEVQQNRYLWIHTAGLAAVPLLLDICLAGLASTGSAFDYPVAFGAQFWAIALLSIVPPLGMQLVKPFYVFSLPPLALKPTALSDDQRRCLQVLKTLQVKILAGLTAGFSLWILQALYAELPHIKPLMTPSAGLITAAVSFFLACLFLQISVSAGRSLLVGPSTLKRVTPYEQAAIAHDFLILGLRVDKLLPIDETSDAPEALSIEPAVPPPAEASSEALEQA